MSDDSNYGDTGVGVAETLGAVLDWNSKQLKTTHGLQTKIVNVLPPVNDINTLNSVILQTHPAAL